MAPLYWCPCIVYGGVKYWLPPSLTLSDGWSQDVELISPPYTSRAIIAEVNDNQGVRLNLTIRGADACYNERQVLDWMEELRTQFRGKTFSLYLFNDRGYERCALDGSDLNIPLGLMRRREGSLSIVSEDVMTTNLETLTFPGGYENDYPYAHLVGRPEGDASGGGPVIVSQPSMQIMKGTFLGGVESVTEAGDEQRFVVGGSPGSLWSLEAVQISSAETFNATGTTQIVVKPQPVGTPSAQIFASVSALEKFSAEGVGNISVAAGSTVYAYATQAGGHQNVQFHFRLKAL